MPQKPNTKPNKPMLFSLVLMQRICEKIQFPELCMKIIKRQIPVEQNIKPISNQNNKLLLFVFISLFVACEFTPKGGGDLLISQSIIESKAKGMFEAEYMPLNSSFIYRDSLLNIKIIFKDVFSEQAHKEKRRIPSYKERHYYKLGEQFVAHFDTINSILTGYNEDWNIREQRAYSKCMFILAYNNSVMIPDTMLLHVYERQGKSWQEDIRIGEIKFVRQK